MKTRIVAIGNSRGLRIPQPLLEQTGITGEVHIEAKKDSLVIRPLCRPRAGWDEEFQQMSRHGEDGLLLGERAVAPESDDREWCW